MKAGIVAVNTTKSRATNRGRLQTQLPVDRKKGKRSQDRMALLPKSNSHQESSCENHQGKAKQRPTDDNNADTRSRNQARRVSMLVRVCVCVAKLSFVE